MALTVVEHLLYRAKQQNRKRENMVDLLNDPRALSLMSMVQLKAFIYTSQCL